MINTIDFKTKTLYIPRKNVGVKKAWGIAIDIGYSSVKVFCENATACIPSFAKKLEGPLLSIGSVSKTRILYEDLETGESWIVGEMAQEMADEHDSESELYGRKRYFSPMFKVITRCGLAMGMFDNQYGGPSGRPIKIQTGLPPKYMTDKEDLVESMSGKHHFRIKVGEDPWKEFDFQITKQDIAIMPQPMGTLFSVSFDRNGRQVPEAKKLWSSNLIIFDPGFGTCDTFYIKNQTIEDQSTFNELSMKEILNKTRKKIQERYNEDIPIASMQSNLKTGNIRIKSRKNGRPISKDVPFANLLEESCNEVCNEALDKLCSVYNALFNCDYLIPTGGLSAVWKPDIIQYFSGLETLKIIPGTQNDNLPSIFNNVRGYYMNLIGTLRQMGY